MTTQAALSAVDFIAAEAARAITASPVEALRTQAAFIRALVDEVESHHPGDHEVAALREQLSEELVRLADIVRGGPEGAGTRCLPALEAPATATDVLVVDDDADARGATVRLLTHWGYTCREADDGAAALADFDRAPTAIVLSDWCMPEMSGLDLCVALKQRLPRPYVILVTAFHDNARLLDAVHGGADDFLRKPLDTGELEARLFAASRLIRAVESVSRLHALA